MILSQPKSYMSTYEPSYDAISISAQRAALSFPSFLKGEDT